MAESQRKLQTADEPKLMQYQNIGQYLFAENEDFRRKSQCCYITKKGFSLEQLKKIEQKAKR